MTTAAPMCSSSRLRRDLRDLLVTNKLKTEWYDEVTSAATHTYDADAAKHANLGLTIANIYGSSSSSN